MYNLPFTIWASLKTQQKLFILHPTDLRHPYKMVVVGLLSVSAGGFFSYGVYAHPEGELSMCRRHSSCLR